MTKNSTPQIAKPTIIQAILETLKGDNSKEVLKIAYPDFMNKFEVVNGIKEITDIFRIGMESNTNGQVQASGNDKNLYYISLRNFCQIINTVLLLDQNNKLIVQIHTKTSPSNKYRTFNYHTSADPGICIIPNTNAWPLSDYAKTTMASKIQGDPTQVLNIFVNIDFILAQISGLVSSDKSQRTVYKLFEPIFTGLNNAMGNINAFAFHYEESQQTFYVVDRQLQVDKGDDIPILDITGLKSTVTKFDFVTKLSPAISTMVAVSAQAGGVDVGLEAEALLRWNEGLTDRITSSRKQSTAKVGNTAAEKEAAKKLKIDTQNKRIAAITKILNTVWTDKKYIKEDLQSAMVQYQAYAAYYLQSYQELGKTAGPAGIVPFEVNIEMDGISGIKIGQAFQINKGIMPTKYHGVVGFIVTGVEHSITANRWITRLKAQTIILEGAASKEVAPDFMPEPLGAFESLITYAPSTATGLLSTNPALDKLKNQIGYYESANNYGVANIGGSSKRSDINVNGIPIENIIARSKLMEFTGVKPDRVPNKQRVFAAGRYQAVPDTLQTALKALGISDKELYSRETQEKVGDWLLLENRKAVGNYIKGINGGDQKDLAAAINQIGYEWASHPVVKRSASQGGKVVGDVVTGIGNFTNYPGVGANPAKVKTTVGTMANLLVYTRKQYTKKAPKFVPTYYDLG